jgi:hypothetical protein
MNLRQRSRLSRHHWSLRLSEEKRVQKDSCLAMPLKYSCWISPPVESPYLTMDSILSRSIPFFSDVSGNSNHVWMIHGANFNISCICNRIIGRVVKQTEDIIATNNLVITVNQMFILLILVLFISVLHWTCYCCHSLAETGIIHRVYPSSVPWSTLRVWSCYQSIQMVFKRICIENHRSCSLQDG